MWPFVPKGCGPIAIFPGLTGIHRSAYSEGKSEMIGTRQAISLELEFAKAGRIPVSILVAVPQRATAQRAVTAWTRISSICEQMLNLGLIGTAAASGKCAGITCPETRLTQVNYPAISENGQGGSCPAAASERE